MAREWAISAYKARLDSAIAAEHWDEADRARVAVMRRLVEMIGKGSSEQEIAGARDALSDSFDRLRLSKRVQLAKGAVGMAARILADAETAGIAAEQAPLPQEMASDVKGRILQLLSRGNRRAWSTNEIAQETKHSVETVSRALSQLRADRKIISRRSGRYVLHRLAEVQANTFSRVVYATANAPVSRSHSGSQDSSLMPVFVVAKDNCVSSSDWELSTKEFYLTKAEPPPGMESNTFAALQDALAMPTSGINEKVARYVNQRFRAGT